MKVVIKEDIINEFKRMGLHKNHFVRFMLQNTETILLHNMVLKE